LAAAANEFDKEARFPLAAGSRLRLDIPVGELRVTGASQEAVSVRLHVKTRNCRGEDLERRVHIRLQPGREARLVIEGLEQTKHWWNRAEVRAEILVPSRTHLDARLGVGEVRVQGVSGDLRAHVGVGQVCIEVPQPGLYKSVRAHAGIGEVRHPFRGKAHGWLGKQFSGNYADGSYRLDADVGVGEVRILEASSI
jgi:hypothetical protein